MFTIIEAPDGPPGITWDDATGAKVQEMLEAMPKEQIEGTLDTMLDRLYALHMERKRDDLWRTYTALTPEDQEAVKDDVTRRKDKGKDR